MMITLPALHNYYHYYYYYYYVSSYSGSKGAAEGAAEAARGAAAISAAAVTAVEAAAGTTHVTTIDIFCTERCCGYETGANVRRRGGYVGVAGDSCR